MKTFHSSKHRHAICLKFGLKVRLSPSKKIYFIYFNESPLKVMQKAFYFILKALFVLEIFTFLFRFFGWVEKRLHKKAMVNFKIL